MNFFNPLGFLGLISIPVIVLMYLLKQKYKEHQVPSLYLWQQALNMSLAQRPWQKLRKNLLMLLQILTACFIVFALSSPYVKGKAELSNYILVLDSGLSMQAEDVKPNRFAKAKELMREFIYALPEGSKVSVVAAGGEPYIAVNFSEDKKSITDKLDRLTVTNSTIALDATENLIHILKERFDAGVYVFSDDSLDLGSIEKSNVVIGESIDNLAITLVSHTVDSDRVIALVKIKNFGASQKTNEVSLYADDKIIDVKGFTIAPGEEKDIFFTNLQEDTKRIVAKLSQNDLLTVDDIAYDSVIDKKIEKAIIITDRNIFLENMFQLLPSVEIYKGDKDSVEDLKGYYLYVFDGILPEKMPADGHILIFNPPVGNSFVETKEDIEIDNIYINDNTLLKFISDIKFDILKSKEMTEPSWADVILSSNQTPLVFSGAIGSQKILVMGFDLHNTDLVLRKEFPIFMYNLIEWFIPNKVFTNENVMVGDTINFNIYPDAEKVSVVSADKNTTDLAPPFPAGPYTNTNSQGIYILEQRLANETIYTSFAVNVDTQASNLLRENINEDEITQAKDMIASNKNLKTICIMILLALLALEWWVYSRGL